MITQNNELSNILKQEFFKDDLHPLLWKGLVIDTDFDGTKFETKIKGALKCRILGIDNYIDIKEEKEILPIVLPFFYKSGILNELPQEGEWVWVMFQYLEPIGQSYWLSIVAENPSKQKNENSIENIYKKLFG